ncbi:hypothetical protein [Sphingomonas sp.]|jgi:hypothetical protein|uniref:hypothetical protein n=1 Tax=Sphingomonas sp. TaxID=28214 RepID=UPI0035637EC4
MPVRIELPYDLFQQVNTPLMSADGTVMRPGTGLPYMPGATPTGATGQPTPGGPAPWTSPSQPQQFTSAPMSQYEAGVNLMRDLYGPGQSDLLLQQLNVQMPDYRGGVDWGAGLGPGVGGNNNGRQSPSDTTTSPPGTLPRVNQNGNLVSGVDYVWGGRPPGGEGLTAGGDLNIGSGGILDWGREHAGDIGRLVGGAGGGPLGAVILGGLGDYISGGGMGTTPVSGSDEYGIMPATPGGVAVNPQPISPLTEQPTSAYANYAFGLGGPSASGGTVGGFYAGQGGGTTSGAGMGAWEAEKDAMLEKWMNRWRNQNS